MLQKLSLNCFYKNVTFLNCPQTNCGIHVIMYSYYFLATLGPKVQKYLWWKRYLTSLQILQFVAFIAMVLNWEVRVWGGGCDWPQNVVHVWLLHMASFLVLFTDFYLKTYSAKQTKSKKDR